LTKREILRRDDFRCQYCGQYTPYLTIDHIIPRRLGGLHAWDNLVAACPPCNHRKGGRTVEQAQMSLLRTPSERPHRHSTCCPAPERQPGMGAFHQGLVSYKSAS
jgi:5-methylcytosine-specific restriction endonuclease McrA